MGNTQNSENKIQKTREITSYYNEAKSDLMCHLLELVFGSLLASYILGFIGFSSSLFTLIKNSTLSFSDIQPSICSLLTYISISASYAYLTAGLYISYHVMILTKPTTHLRNMRWDFIIALAQALCYGLSMILVSFFPLFLAFVLWIAFLRQHFEYRDFKNQMYKFCDLKKTETDEGVRIDKKNNHREEFFCSVKRGH